MPFAVLDCPPPIPDPSHRVKPGPGLRLAEEGNRPWCRSGKRGLREGRHRRGLWRGTILLAEAVSFPLRTGSLERFWSPEKKALARKPGFSVDAMGQNQEKPPWAFEWALVSEQETHSLRNSKVRGLERGTLITTLGHK